jgi:hypothetical protein
MLLIAPARLTAGYGRSGFAAIRTVAVDVTQAMIPRIIFALGQVFTIARTAQDGFLEYLGSVGRGDD